MPEVAVSTNDDQQPETAIKYDRFLDCVHCGLCTAACPTYLETGDENNSPRGRIHLMRAVTDDRLELDEDISRHLDLCLDCRACETACPSGVEYGRLIEPFRAEHGHRVGWLEHQVINRLFPSRKLLGASLSVARVLQRSGADHFARKIGLLRLMPRVFQRMHRMLPTLPANEGPHPPVETPDGAVRARVGLFTGCVADAMSRPMHHATRRVLIANGCEVVTPNSQNCCGAIPYHGGNGERAIEFVVKNLDAFEQSNVDFIVVNVAGCGALWKELPELSRELAPNNSRLHKRCDSVAAKVRDISEFLVELGPVPPKTAVNQRVVYHAACHLLHAQGVADAPLELIRLIPGLSVETPDELGVCCGAAGSYNLTEPDMAVRLGRRKVDRLLACFGGEEFDAIVSANIGCTMHLGAELRDRGRAVEIRHPVELLDVAYRN